MTKILKVGLIGYGFAGKTFHAPFIVNNANMELAKVASSDAAKVHADYPDVQVVATPEDIFADPAIDLVVIPTPNDTHFRWRGWRWLRVNMWWWISPLP